MVDAYDSNTNLCSTGGAKLLTLPHQVTCNSVNLLYHRLRQNLHFDPDLTVAISPRRTTNPGPTMAWECGTCFTKGRIAAARRYPTKCVPDIENADARLDQRVQSRRKVQ